MAKQLAKLRTTRQTLVIGRFIQTYLGLAGISLLLAIFWMQSIDSPSTTPQTFPTHFYQHIVGTLDGRSCSSYPVCSQYASQAMQQYGLLFGSWLTLDRLIHEADDLQRGPWIYVDGEARLNDPIERNAFWLEIR